MARGTLEPTCSAPPAPGVRGVHVRGRQEASRPLPGRQVSGWSHSAAPPPTHPLPSFQKL